MKKVLSVLLFICILASCSACSKSGAGSGAGKQITLQLFDTFWVPGMVTVDKAAINEFQKENPNIKIKETRVSWTDAPSQLETSVMGGQAPDIVTCNPAMVAEFRGINAFADITDMIPADLKNSFKKPALAIVTNSKGRIDGIPQEGCTWQIFYRKDLFEKAGLDPNQPPKTWDELVKDGQALTKDTNGDGKIDQWGFAWPMQAENAGNFWVTFMQQAGSSISNFDGKEWVSQLKDKEAVQGTQFMVDLVRKYHISPPTLVDQDWEAVTNGFVAGNYAMMENGAWVVASVESKGPNLKGKWGTATMFTGPSGKQTCMGFPNTFNILNASKNKEAAWKFLDFFYTKADTSDKTNSTKLTYAENICKAADSILWTSKYIDYADSTYDPLVKPFSDGTEFSAWPPMDPKWQNLSDMFVGSEIQQMIMGQVSVQNGLNDLNSKLVQLHGNGK